MRCNAVTCLLLSVSIKAPLLGSIYATSVTTQQSNLNSLSSAIPSQLQRAPSLSALPLLHYLPTALNLLSSLSDASR